MTAVDQAGNNVAVYKISEKKHDRGWRTGLQYSRPVDITVNPDWNLTDELLLVIGISAEWLDSYFDEPSGGGG